MTNKRFVLINRIHLDKKGKKNMFDILGDNIGFKLNRIEPTKAVGITGKKKVLINKRLKQFNKKHDTDFFM